MGAPGRELRLCSSLDDSGQRGLKALKTKLKNLAFVQRARSLQDSQATGRQPGAGVGQAASRPPALLWDLIMGGISNHNVAYVIEY